MFSYWPMGPTSLAVIGLITGILVFSTTCTFTTHSAIPSTSTDLDHAELDQARGWYGLEVNGGPTQYHLTLRPLERALKLGCLSRLTRGDLIKLSLTKHTCELRRGRLSAADLHALRVPLQLNSVSVEDLTLLRGLGARRAQRVVAGQPWRSVKELTRIKGIGPRTLKKLRPYLTVDPEPLLWASSERLHVTSH